ncbi:MAG: hypothetical protein EPO67_17350 [Reyranella sp.]|nr:MAG: hypothetical protein EPO67_17350 [Reyranella sp.]
MDVCRQPSKEIQRFSCMRLSFSVAFAALALLPIVDAHAQFPRADESSNATRQGVGPLQGATPLEANSPLQALTPAAKLEPPQPEPISDDSAAARIAPPASAESGVVESGGPLQGAGPLQRAAPVLATGPLDTLGPLRSARPSPGPAVQAGSTLPETGPFVSAHPLQRTLSPGDFEALAPGGQPLVPTAPAREFANGLPPLEAVVVPVSMEGLLAQVFNVPGGVSPLLLASLVDAMGPPRPDPIGPTTGGYVAPPPPPVRPADPPLPPFVNTPTLPPTVFTPPPQVAASPN